MNSGVFLVWTAAIYLLGCLIRQYVQRFADNLNRTLQQNYADYYADVVAKPLDSEYHWLQPLPQRELKYLPLIFTLLLCPSLLLPLEFFARIWQLYCLALLTAIALADYYYRLISTTLCLHLLLSALFGSWLGIAPLTLTQSVESLFVALVPVGLFFFISKWIYRKEVFGEGDCWLICALATFFPCSQLPLLLFVASAMGLLWALCCHRTGLKNLALPFAPLLAVATVLIFIAPTE
ncbi:A24 family peptidase [Chelonobacter oris]|uniref:A24 family peptidase n=1 Tax=Chelonobacter oris TaxID=505317 RepID=UPI00069133CE|nr:A24 family peptidase [Chelonobacter oris]